MCVIATDATNGGRELLNCFLELMRQMPDLAAAVAKLRNKLSAQRFVRVLPEVKGQFAILPAKEQLRCNPRSILSWLR